MQILGLYFLMPQGKNRELPANEKNSPEALAVLLKYGIENPYIRFLWIEVI
jgi:hypothetical protein